MAKVKVVIVHHQNNATHYTFKVPEKVDLEAGDIILCDTSIGKNQVGYCITPSYYVPEDSVWDMFGVSPARLKPVTGRLQPVMFIYEHTKEEENP